MTAPAPATPPEHCEHECVCGDYAIVMFDESEEKQACCAIRKCEHDTRSRPAPSPETLYTAGMVENRVEHAKAQAREDTLMEIIPLLDTRTAAYTKVGLMLAKHRLDRRQHEARK